MATSVRVALVTCPTQSEARALARSVVEDRLAACVNILDGVTSVYRWEGAVEEDQECLLVIKTTEDGVSALRQAVASRHSYDEPEFIVLPVTEGLAGYLNWVEDSVGG